MIHPTPEPTTANIARTYDYLMGGDEHYAVDRQVGDELLRRTPGMMGIVWGNRQFLAYGVQRALEGGVRQFVDVGAGLPTTGNTHQVAAEETDEPVTVVYVDNDPVVVEHSARLVAALPTVHAMLGDAADPAGIMAAAAQYLDMAAPVAVLMCCVLHFVARPPREVLGEYLAILPAGSMVIVSHGTGTPEAVAAVERTYREAGMEGYGRLPEELEAAFAGWDVRAPGLARVEDITHADELEGMPPSAWLAAAIADKPRT